MAVILLVVLPGCESAPRDTAPPAPVEFRTVFADTATAQQPVADFEWQGARYRLAGNDTVALRQADRRVLRIPLDEFFFIERVRAADYHGDLLVLLEISDSESGSAILARADTAGTVKWRRDLRAFNIADPLVRGDDAYLSGIGLVARVRLDDGRPVWLHDGLFNARTNAFNSFATPEFKGDTVIFRDAQPGSTRAAKVLNSTGELRLVGAP